jgi:uncharacterized membrane protein
VITVPVYYSHAYHYTNGGPLPFLFGFFLITLLFLLVVMIVNHRQHSSPGQIFHNPASGPVSTSEDLLSIAQRRLAMGEITSNEYDDIVARIYTKPKNSQS